MGTELFDLVWVQAIVLFFSQLGWALFGVSLVVCIFEFGVEYSTGRANIQQTAINILKENIDKLHELAAFLMERESITGEEFMEILNRQPLPEHNQQ